VEDAKLAPSAGHVEDRASEGIPHHHDDEYGRHTYGPVEPHSTKSNICPTRGFPIQHTHQEERLLVKSDDRHGVV
jgi:hypothetical protein